MSNVRTLAIATFAGLFLLGAPPPAALADGDDLVEAEDAVFREAVRAAAKEDWATCRTKAAGVWHTVKSPKVAALLGSCEAELGLYRDSAEHLDFFLQRDDGKNEAPARAAKKRFPEVRAKVMLVEIAVQPPADVRVDGVAFGSTPVRVFLDPGSHTIDLSKKGYSTKTASITATAGGSQKLDVKLDPESAGAGPAGAGGNGGAPPGIDTSATTGAGGVEQPPPEGKEAWPAILMGGIGAAGLATGIALVVVGTKQHGDALDAARACEPWSPGCADEANSQLDEANALNGGGIAALVVGAAAAVGMVIYLAVPSNTDAQSARIAPFFEPGAGGLSLEGSF